ncbi:MAG: 30S ribosomal protein S7 [Candidatus Glassbacteria bacterium]|nr:30S ribosomal protein S7 [Candidatus Glassbacteria bacterium]
MSRRSQAEKREILPDSRYQSTLVSKFINALMKKGKRSIAETILYKSLAMLEEKVGQPGLNVFKQAVNNAKPALEVKSRRVGGATYQVPVEVRPERRTALAMRWMIGFARARNEKTMEARLAAELLSCFRNEGTTIKKKEDTHRMAEANRAFAHYRW